MSDSSTLPTIRRLNISADLERYSRWTREEQATAQQDLKDVLRTAASATGVALDQWSLQPAGDAELAILPPGVDEGHVLREFPKALRAALYRVNRGADERKRLRVRVAMYVGITELGDLGFVGAAPIAVGRLRDSRPVRDAMQQHPHADYALVISDVLYEDHLGHLDPEFNVDSFRSILVELPHKEFRSTAFLYVPPAPTSVAARPDDPGAGPSSSSSRADRTKAKRGRKEPAGPTFKARKHKGHNISVSGQSTYVGGDQSTGVPPTRGDERDD